MQLTKHLTIPFTLGISLFLAVFLFVAQQLPSLHVFHWFPFNTVFYIWIPINIFALLISLSQEQNGWHWTILKRFLIIILPSILLLYIGTQLSKNFHYSIPFSLGFYIILWFLYFVKIFLKKKKVADDTISLFAPLRWKEAANRKPLITVLGLTLVFFTFGLQNLAHFAAVDEPLWLDGRIGKFWKNIKEERMDRTLVSDKPGITLVWATTPGLFLVAPKDYREARFEFQAKKPDVNIESYFFAFRFPLLLTITLLLPLVYIFLRLLIDRWPAVLGYAAITLSPILIGMSKIVNPDSLLWLFVLLSFLTYLIFLEKKAWRFVIISGIFLGLALLTKYVANFLIVYFFGYIFLFGLWKNELNPKYVHTMFQAFLLWIGIALALLYITVPAFWVEPTWLLTSTLFSQAFEKVAWLFIGLITVVLFDQYVLKDFIMLRFILLLNYLKRYLHKIIIGCFALFLFVVIINGLLGMPLIDSVELLASPKSSYQIHTLTALFFTHFYPLLFGSAPLILVGILYMLWKTYRTPLTNHSTSERLLLANVLFILLFYLGSTINHVALINRYQIMLYPLLALVGGIGLFFGVNTFLKQWEKTNQYHPGFLTVLICCSILLLTPLTTPFPLSYSSFLLPKNFTTDIKDMGAGSYEAAEYLNSLPSAKTNAIWTDKNGVCKFYIGPCYDGLDFLKASKLNIRYLVLSSGRASRTSRFYERTEVLGYPEAIRLDTYYNRTDPIHEILINSRPSQSVKIFSLAP